MADLMSAAQLIQKMNNLHATAQFLAGKSFTEDVQPFKEILARFAEIERMHVPEALCTMLVDMKGEPGTTIWLTAAAVELMREVKGDV